MKEEDIQKNIIQIVHKEPDLRLQDLVSRVSNITGAPYYLVTRALYKLKTDGKIKLEDINPPSSLSMYVKSHYSLWFWAVILSIFITIITIYLLPQNPPFIYLRYAFGSIFILYLPGYSLIEALYPRKEDLEGLERLALSIGLSLAIVPLVGLILNYTPWGIRLEPIIISLAILTSMLALIAALRKVSYIKTVLSKVS
ncbi:MAG: DUF1616 domain-containing protein [Nitrososphaerales archaeon]